MPDVLRRRDQLRQQIRAGAGEALEAPEARPGRREEQIVIEEAGVDRLIELEGVRVRRGAVDGHDTHANRIEHAGPGIEIVDGDRGHARHIAFDLGGTYRDITAVDDTDGAVGVENKRADANRLISCLLYTSPSPRDGLLSRMPS